MLGYFKIKNMKNKTLVGILIMILFIVIGRFLLGQLNFYGSEGFLKTDPLNAKIICAIYTLVAAGLSWFIAEKVIK